MALPTAPPEVLSLLKEREGWRTDVYLDSLDKPTSGMGHLLSESELAQYPVGSTVPEDILEQWQASDVNTAYLAALAQSAAIGFDNQILVNALASVSFQLGADWHKKLYGTWNLLTTHQWSAAAAHEELSLWAKETPLRAKDFADALISLE